MDRLSAAPGRARLAFVSRLVATRFNIVSVIVAPAMVLAAAGVAIGIVLAPMVLRLTSGMLFGVGPFDPVTLVTVTTVMAGVAIAASTIPAIRAARLGSVPLR